MITLKIDNKYVENIFLNEFHSNKEKFLEFIQNSYEKMNATKSLNNVDSDLRQLQEISMSKTWDNDEDKAWDEL